MLFIVYLLFVRLYVCVVYAAFQANKVVYLTRSVRSFKKLYSRQLCNVTV